MCDAVACAAGEPWAAFEDLIYDVLLRGAQNKVLGQVELVRQGIAHLSPAGSFTLISGVLADEPVPGGTAAAFGTVFPDVIRSRSNGPPAPTSSRSKERRPGRSTECADRERARAGHEPRSPLPTLRQAPVHVPSGGHHLQRPAGTAVHNNHRASDVRGGWTEQERCHPA
jgi:hypothetical protein